MKLFRRFTGVAILAVLAVSVQAGEPARCTLELKRFEANQSPLELNLSGSVSPQTFFMQIHDGKRMGGEDKTFKETVKTEPSKYVSEHPFRGVISLGSKKYGFAFDKKDEKSSDYDRLYFDLNGNGDLSDDKPIDKVVPAPPPKKEKTEKPTGVWSLLFPGTSSSPPAELREPYFPRVDLTIDVGGKKLDYSFTAEVQSWGREKQRYIWASLKSAVYREGTLSLNGRQWKVVLLDSNSNGRFDDRAALAENVRGSDNELVLDDGDVFIVMPQNETGDSVSTRGSPEVLYNALAKLTVFQDKYYNIDVSPLGEDMTWKPSAIAKGSISSPHAPCNVQLAGELGVIDLHLEKSKPAPVPVGKWRVYSYMIQIENWKDPEKEKEKKEKEKNKTDEKKSILGALVDSLLDSSESQPRGGMSAMSMVYARGTTKGRLFTVAENEATQLTFGPPYKPSVSVASNPGVAYLSLDIQGSDGENIAYLIINGQRPPKPKITITDHGGKVVVDEGEFEYG